MSRVVAGRRHAPASSLGSGAGRIPLNAGAQATADVLAKLAVLGLYAVVARRLGAAALGHLTLAQSVAVFLQLAALGTDPLLTAEAARRPARLRPLFWSSLQIKVGLGLPAAVVIAVAALAGVFGPATRDVLLLFTLSSLLDLLADTVAAGLRSMEVIVPIAISQVAQRVVTVAVALVALLSTDMGIVAVGLGYAVGSVVGLLLQVRWLRVQGADLRRTWDVGRSIVVARKSLSLGVAAALGAVLARADAILLAAMTTATVVGTYGAPYRLLESTFFLSWALGFAVYPVLSRLDAGTAPTLGRAFSASARAMVAGLVPIGAAFVLFPTFILHLIYGDSVPGAETPLRWLGVAAALYGLGLLAVLLLAARGRRGAFARLSGVVAALNIGLNLLLIPSLGATGAAVAMAVAQVAFTGLAFGLAVRTVGDVSVPRLLGLPLGPVLVMVGVRLAVGDEAAGILLAGAGYVAALGVAHRLIFPGDSDDMLARLRGRPARLDAPGL